MKFSEMKYERPDREKILKQLSELAGRIKAAKSGEEQFEIHKEFYKIYEHFITARALVEVRNAIDTTDEFYEKENDFFDEFLPVIQNVKNEYDKALYDSPYRAYLEDKIGRVAFKNTELSLKAYSEKITELMQEENSLVSRYNKLIATAKIEFEGEVYNISLLRPHLTDKDRDHRKKAWKALSDYFLSVTGEIDEIFDKMVKNRTAQAKAMGYKDYVELGYYRMQRNSYDREMVENFRRQVKSEFVPFVKKLEEKRKQRLGLSELKYYDNDVFFSEGNPAPTGTPEEILKKGQEMYKELSAETGEFFDFMQESELFDVLGRKNKRAGGFMTYFPDHKAPFIFANFNGTSSDVDVITHECGHAFQGYLTRDDEIMEHNDLTMETAEIHSMSMEYFTYNWMDKFFGERKDDYLTMHLEDSAQFLPYGCMVDEFQHIVYSKPDMTPMQRKEAWKKLEGEYRPWLDYDNDPFFAAGGWWQKQLHIFCYPFYYIDYVLASVCAMQFKIAMDKDYKDAWERYLKLCRLSVRDFYVPELKAAGLDSPFEDGCIKHIVEEMEKKV